MLGADIFSVTLMRSGTDLFKFHNHVSTLICSLISLRLYQTNNSTHDACTYTNNSFNTKWIKYLKENEAYVVVLVNSKRVGRVMKHAEQSQFSQVSHVTRFDNCCGTLGVITLIRDFRDPILVLLLYQFK